MITVDKITEIFYMKDYFYKVFDAQSQIFFTVPVRLSTPHCWSSPFMAFK